MVVQDSGWWFLKTMIRKGRMATGKSQRQVGDEIFRSKDTILEWEKGRVDIPAGMVDAIARACKLTDEERDYMKAVAAARRAGRPIEADARFNAIFLALAEASAGYVFKFDALLIPGPFQPREYHYSVVSRTEPGASPEAIDGGWAFKQKRAKELSERLGRHDRPQVHVLVGEAALLHTLRVSQQLHQTVMEHLRTWARKPGVSTRILREPVHVRNGNFSIYTEGDIPGSCPATVFTEIADSSWLINDPVRIASYDDIRKTLWKMAIRIEDYNDADWRYGLA